MGKFEEIVSLYELTDLGRNIIGDKGIQWLSKADWRAIKLLKLRKTEMDVEGNRLAYE
jgi:hypothetical protein